jgi:multidrug efflux pump subunit AcrA (membrane-fusion protein)
MAIDEVREERPVVVRQERSWNAGMTVIAIVVAMLVIGEIATLSNMSSLKTSLQQAQAKSAEGLSAKVDQKLTALEQSNAQVIEALKEDLSNSEQKVGMTQSELRRARATVAKLGALEQEQTKEAEELKSQIALKADSTQVGAIGQDLSATKDDLGNTKKNVDKLSSDLGMARSQLGTLIATNHGDIETLRKLGERDYVEFTLAKNNKKTVAGVNLILKKANAKHQLFNIDMTVNDRLVEKKNRTIDEPIVFSPDGSRKFYELVVNKVSSNQVTGYISTPKGAELASARPEGTTPQQ